MSYAEAQRRGVYLVREEDSSRSQWFLRALGALCALGALGALAIRTFDDLGGGLVEQLLVERLAFRGARSVSGTR